LSAARAARAKRLVELRERAVREAQAALAEATRAVATLTKAANDAELAWSSYADALPTTMPAAELAESSYFVATLRQRANQAAARVVKGREEEERQRQNVQRARAEQRKIELWREGIVRGIHDEERRLDRVASDEIASRMTEKTR
jgi:flagellar biosynthesis chaperone FliJ